ncbi:MAG: MOSC N-terminal beta barrel domain-containing protein [Gemmatimonadota bacterium]
MTDPPDGHKSGTPPHPPSGSRVEALWIYPLKGARGMSVDTLEVVPGGPAYDRRWMLVDAEGQFISQRTLPALTQLSARPQEGGLILEMAGGAFEVPTPSGLSIPAQVWGDAVRCVPAGPAADRWLSHGLRKAVRLVHLPATELRAVDANFAPGHEVGLADGYPFLVVSTGSLEELNRRLDDSVTMERFRPNVVVADPTPHVEDGWHRFQIGDVSFRGVKPCARCSVPTLDPRTGEGGVEPLRTLATYRRWNGKVWFGMNAVAQGSGEVEVGAMVQIQEGSRSTFPEVLAETFRASDM